MPAYAKKVLTLMSKRVHQLEKKVTRLTKKSG